MLTLDEISEAIYCEERAKWLQAGKRGKEPKRISRQAVNDTLTRALIKSRRALEQQGVRLEDYFD